MSRKAARPDANHPAGRHLPRVARARQKGRRAFAITHRYVEIPPIRSGSGGQTLAGSSCCIRQATRHRGYLHVIAGANVHPFGRDVTGGRPGRECFGRRFRARLEGPRVRVSPRQGQGLPANQAPAGTQVVGIRTTRPRRHGVGRRWLSGPRWYRAGMRARRMRPMRTAARTSGTPGHAGGATRSVNVTGPSLVRVTCIRAPNRPVSTSGCNECARSTT